MIAFLLSNWKLLGSLALIGGLVFAVVAHVQHDRSVSRQLAEMTDQRNAWRTSSIEWQASFRGAEELRRQERATALSDAQAASDTCETRVASARRSQAAIRSIVERPPTVVNGCPVRESVGAGELRGAVQ